MLYIQFQNNILNYINSFIADPPTTTQQRIKGLTTGSLPTFIDIKNSFASKQIFEDNILSQIKSHNKHKLLFFGDDTWISLFPHTFDTQFDYPSFGVYDLDTVDHGIDSQLFNQIQQIHQSSFFIAHYLGLDHAGHRFFILIFSFI